MKTFKWTIEFTVTENWVADGFNLDKERAEEMLEAALPFSLPHERKARVVCAPCQKEIATTQGYSSIKQMQGE